MHTLLRHQKERAFSVRSVRKGTRFVWRTQHAQPKPPAILQRRCSDVLLLPFLSQLVCGSKLVEPVLHHSKPCRPMRGDTRIHGVSGLAQLSLNDARTAVVHGACLRCVSASHDAVVNTLAMHMGPSSCAGGTQPYTGASAQPLMGARLRGGGPFIIATMLMVVVVV